MGRIPDRTLTVSPPPDLPHKGGGEVSATPPHKGEGDQRARTLRNGDDLVLAGIAQAFEREAITRVAERYAVAVTPAVARLIDSSDANDPIARQFVPDVRELDLHPRELVDPISDHAKSPVKGVVHRYGDRVLLKIASVCPVYCRFCFRREMVGPGLGEALTPKDLAAALVYIREHEEISEVILTGGDPFVLSATKIAEVTRALDDIAHVQMLRWHTRLPIADPARVTEGLAAALNASSKIAVVAIHTNHPRELSPAAGAAIARLLDAGIPLLSQSVLLKGVNDDAATLEALMRGLVARGIKPYYLHHGDLAPGTAHFRTTIAEGKALMRDLRARLPEDAVPRYVLDIPGGFGKVDIEKYVTAIGSGRYCVRDANGGLHEYEDL